MASNSRDSIAASASAGDAAECDSKPSCFSNSRRASRMSAWSSASNTRYGWEFWDFMRVQNRSLFHFPSVSTWQIGKAERRNRAFGRLLVAQRNDRIHARRPPRRDQTGRHRDHAGSQHCQRKRERVFGREAEQKRTQEPRSNKSQRQAQENAGDTHSQTLPQNHPEHLLALRPESHAHANFTSSPANTVSESSVQACGHKKRSEEHTSEGEPRK